MKKLIIPAFIIMMAAQLYVPASMILDREKVIANGEAFLFVTEPIDPRDPFRGQYIRLDFEEDYYVPSDINRFRLEQELFVHLKKDENNIAKITCLSVDKPESGAYLKAQISHIQNDRVYIQYPFERFYMEESKAPQAEKVLRQISAEDRQKAFARVYILAGKSVLTDVVINDISLREIGKE